MRRFPPGPTSQLQKETRSPPPCVRSIFHLLRRSKTDMPAPAQPAKRSTRVESTRFSPSCDDAKPFHFPIKPDAVNDQRDRDHKRADCAGQINRRAFHEIDPDAPCSDPERKQRRENYKNNMEPFKGHLTNDRVVVPRQKDKPEKSEHKETGKNENAIDEPFFCGKMHENCGD